MRFPLNRRRRHIEQPPGAGFGPAPALCLWLCLCLIAPHAFADMQSVRAVRHAFMADFGDRLEALLEQDLQGRMQQQRPAPGIPVYLHRPPAYDYLALTLGSSDNPLLSHQPTRFAGYRTDAADREQTTLLGHLSPVALSSVLQVSVMRSPDDNPLSTSVEADDLSGADTLLITLTESVPLQRGDIEMTGLVATVGSTETSRGLLERLMPAGGGATPYRRGTVSDPRVAAALSRAYSGQPIDALADLLQLSDQIERLTLVPAHLRAAIGTVAARAGMLQRSTDMLAAISPREAPVVATSLRLDLAEAQLKRGALTAASRTLAGFDRELAPMYQLRWQDLSARTLIDAGDPARAAARYRQAEGLFYEASRNLDNPVQARRIAAYSRYNRAIAYLASDNNDAGRSWLDIAGRAVSTDPELLALRDKANVTLGWQLLESGHGLTALEVLGRARLDGPYSRPALLGTAWALLRAADTDAPPEPVRRLPAEELGVSTDDRKLPDFVTDALIQRRLLDPELYGPQSLRRRFGNAERPESLSDAARRALVYLQILAGQDPTDPAVQESLVVSGLAWHTLGDEAQATAQYQGAIRRLEALLADVDEARQRIQNRGWLAGFLFDLADPQRGRLPGADPEARVLASAALADDGLLVIDQYRRLHALTGRLPESQTDALERDMQGFLQQRLQQGLADQERQIKRYLKSAYAGYLDLTVNLPANGGAAAQEPVR